MERWEAKKAKEAQALADGKYIRKSALATVGDTVHVLFINKDGEYIGKYMTRDVYHAIELGELATLEDYTKHGAVLDAPSTFDNGETTKEV